MPALTYLTAEEYDRLQRLIGESTKPENQRLLTDADLDDHAKHSRVPDENGNGPGDAGYTNTVDLYRAASLCWHQKAGIFAEEFQFEADGGRFFRNQKYDMAIAQAKRYADMAQGHSTPIKPEERP